MSREATVGRNKMPNRAVSTCNQEPSMRVYAACIRKPPRHTLFEDTPSIRWHTHCALKHNIFVNVGTKTSGILLRHR